MTKTEMQRIAEELTEELRNVPDGTEITTAQLLRLCGYDTERLSLPEMMGIHTALAHTAKKARVTLDMSAHKGKEEGLPVHLAYTVHNENAKVRCPHCGSGNTARILYGMPAFSKKLEHDIRSGKIHLGGCMLTEVTDAAGNSIPLDPARYCNACKKEFARPAYLPTEDFSGAEAYTDIVTGLRFTYSKRFPQQTELCIEKNDAGAAVSVSCFPGAGEAGRERQITKRQWNKLTDRLFGELYLHEWKKEYTDPNVLDGEQWSLEIRMTEDRRLVWNGSNAFPVYWQELNALFRPFLRDGR